MRDFDDLDTYNGDTELDMWADFVNYENTGSAEVFNESDIDIFINNLNDWD